MDLFQFFVLLLSINCFASISSSTTELLASDLNEFTDAQRWPMRSEQNLGLENDEEDHLKRSAIDRPQSSKSINVVDFNEDTITDESYPSQSPRFDPLIRSNENNLLIPIDSNESSRLNQRDDNAIKNGLNSEQTGGKRFNWMTDRNDDHSQPQQLNSHQLFAKDLENVANPSLNNDSKDRDDIVAETIEENKQNEINLTSNESNDVVPIDNDTIGDDILDDIDGDSLPIDYQPLDDDYENFDNLDWMNSTNRFGERLRPLRPPLYGGGNITRTSAVDSISPDGRNRLNENFPNRSKNPADEYLDKIRRLYPHLFPDDSGDRERGNQDASLGRFDSGDPFRHHDPLYLYPFNQSDGQGGRDQINNLGPKDRQGYPIYRSPYETPSHPSTAVGGLPGESPTFTSPSQEGTNAGTKPVDDGNRNDPLLYDRLGGSGRYPSDKALWPYNQPYPNVYIPPPYRPSAGDQARAYYPSIPTLGTPASAYPSRFPGRLLSSLTLYPGIRNSTYPGFPGYIGFDYPGYSSVPFTGFRCDLQPYRVGYYADVAAGCQAFHVCQRDGRMDSFLCPNGTLFHQKVMTCDWWYLVNCPSSPSYYYLNGRIGVLPPLPATLSRF
ncbi:hypothetical protein NH340_JMT07971 [Sarcoptes scabiei]|nr:hypothetical protein NH340_JMT07971 [Sarcoptes scabiei]